MLVIFGGEQFGRKTKPRAHCESVRQEAGKGLDGGGGRGIDRLPQDAAGICVTAGLRAEMKTVNGWPWQGL